MGIRYSYIVSWAAVIVMAMLAGSALASSRVALVIGNADYAHVPALANPRNDAADVAAVLGDIGFEVTRLENADYATLRRGLRAFRREAAAAKIAVVFYAGHGIEVSKHNFLVPVDASLQTDGDVEYEAMPLDRVVNAVQGASELRLVVLDACRENPFLKSMKREKGSTRSIGRGLARPPKSGGDTLIVYSAEEGQTAADGKGRNSPYTSALLRYMKEPGLEVGMMFRTVHKAVRNSTGDVQIPQMYGSLSDERYYFIPPTVKDSAGQTSAAAQGSALEMVALQAKEDREVDAAAASLTKVQSTSRDLELEFEREFQDCPQCPRMVVVPAGTYEMGSPSDKGAGDEEQRHRVTIADALAIGMFEVTRGEFSRFVNEMNRRMAGGACWQYDGMERKEGAGPTDPGFIQGDDEPMVCVSWSDAQAYVDWLSARTQRQYRLPSESEWEYAARAGTGTARYWDGSDSGQCRNANGADDSLTTRYTDWFELTASCDDGHAHTSEAGRYGPNRFGLYDMLGNAREWVEDCWHSDYEGAPSDGSAWTEGGNCRLRVLRGGSWLDGPGGVRSSTRDRSTTGIRFSANGFRVARSLN